jgi:hypothetical protein
MTTIKAIRATIKLGDIDIDVFQLPNGSYGYSYDWIATLIERDKSVLSHKKSPFYLPRLLPSLIDNGLSNRRVSVEGISRTNFSWLTQNEIVDLLDTLAFDHNIVVCRTLLKATTHETLDRRSDNSFGVKRTEEQRNQFLKARMEGKCVRRTLTDSIKEYINRHPELSENYSRFVYSNCTDCVNLVVLGAKSKQVKVELDLKPTGLLRDVIPYATLREIEAVEVLAGRLIDAEDLEPLEACKKALQLIHARTLGYGQ